jgi:hypothetical protein
LLVQYFHLFSKTAAFLSLLCQAIEFQGSRMLPADLVPALCFRMGITLGCDAQAWAELVELHMEEVRSRSHSAGTSCSSRSAPSTPMSHRSGSSSVVASPCYTLVAMSEDSDHGTAEYDSEDLHLQVVQANSRYSELPHEIVCLKAESLEQENDELKKRIRLLQQSGRRQKQRLDVLVNAKPLMTPEQQLAIQKKKGDHRLTMRGVHAMGVRMSLSSTSASAMPKAGMIDVSRYTISRCEVATGSAMFARARLFHDIIWAFLSKKNYRMKRERASKQSKTTIVLTAPETGGDDHEEERQLAQFAGAEDSPESPYLADFTLPNNLLCQNFDSCGGLKLVGTAFAGDATNTSIWQRKKLSSLEVETLLLIDIKALELNDITGAFAGIRVVSAPCCFRASVDTKDVCSAALLLFAGRVSRTLLTWEAASLYQGQTCKLSPTRQPLAILEWYSNS